MNSISEYFIYIKYRIKNITTNYESDYYENFFVKNSEWNQYEPNDDELSRWLAIESLVNKIEMKGKSKILDVGSGRGWLSNKLKSYGRVTGIEPVKSVAENARKTYSEIEFLALNLKQFLRKNFSEKFELVVCSEVIEHVFYKKLFLRRMRKIIRSNGFLIITTPRRELKSEWEDKYGKPSQPLEIWIQSNDLIKLLKTNVSVKQS